MQGLQFDSLLHYINEKELHVSEFNSYIMESFNGYSPYTDEMVEDNYQLFKTWIKNLLTTYPLPSMIKVLHFGIFEEDTNIVNLYVSGSRHTYTTLHSEFAYDHDYYPENNYSYLPILRISIPLQVEFAQLFINVCIQTLLHDEPKLIPFTIKVTCGVDENKIYLVR